MELHDNLAAPSSPALGRIVIELEPGGFCTMVTHWQGVQDMLYRGVDTQLLRLALPQAIEELRLQAQQGSRATVAQSASIRQRVHKVQ